MVSYRKLIQILAERGINRTQLGADVGLSSRTVAKIAKGERLSATTLARIAAYLEVDASDLMDEVSSNSVLQVLRDQKSAGISGGLYHELQVRMTYNSNHMEGSRLSEEQTRMIFETRTLDVADGVLVDDIIEASNHFRAIDYVIDVAEEPLSEEAIKRIHCILKQGTRDADLPWFAVGAYKTRPNVVGGRATASPSDVPARMAELLEGYTALGTVTFEDIVCFHAVFERIHPFQDGNGRVGRLVALKECLRHGIVPFYIEDAKKGFYYRGLAEWERERGWLVDTCRDGQDQFERLLDMFAVDHTNRA